MISTTEIPRTTTTSIEITEDSTAQNSTKPHVLMNAAPTTQSETSQVVSSSDSIIKYHMISSLILPITIIAIFFPN
jgi:hypothetical protein